MLSRDAGSCRDRYPGHTTPIHSPDAHALTSEKTRLHALTRSSGVGRSDGLMCWCWLIFIAFVQISVLLLVAVHLIPRSNAHVKKGPSNQSNQYGNSGTLLPFSPSDCRTLLVKTYIYIWLLQPLVSALILHALATYNSGVGCSPSS